MCTYTSDAEKLSDAWFAWLKTDRVERFGQYLINRNIVSDNNALWNETDPHKAYAIAWQIKGQ